MLGGEDAAWLVARVRRRLERGQPLTGPVNLPSASPAQRDAVERLLGRRPKAATGITVRLEDLDTLLRGSGAHPDGLADAVIALTGPVTDQTAEAARLASAWAAVYAPLDAVAAHRPALAGWLDGVRAAGTIRRLTRDPDTAAALVNDLVSVLQRLPTEPEPAGRFAERILGSAHGLDPDRPLTGLVFGAARALGALPDGAGAGWTREVWASVGLLRDELSSAVLTLNLPSAPGPVGRMLGVLGEAGEPAVLTLRQLRAAPDWRLAGITVSVCENPVVTAEAAERYGPAAAPMVCVSGQPGAAAMAVLRALAGAGARLRYHGDFDWPGLRIGNLLFSRLPMAPWRFDAAAYRAVRIPAALQAPLRGKPCVCSWDPELDAAMIAGGHAVEEEHVLDELLNDLRATDLRAT